MNNSLVPNPSLLERFTQLSTAIQGAIIAMIVLITLVGFSILGYCHKKRQKKNIPDKFIDKAQIFDNQEQMMEYGRVN
jgi:hypothetical protein